MTTLTHPTHAALLEAIRANPDDDTVRLALADYLEEGTDPAWSELIHVQVELARRVDNDGIRLQDPKCTRPRKDHYINREMQRTHCIECWKSECDRESALLAEHEPRWRRGEPCKWCRDGTAKDIQGAYAIRCADCRGTGWSRWWLAEQITWTDVGRATATSRRITTWRHRVHFVRGFPEQVDANLADIFDEQGKATEWALACVRGEPGLRRFGVVDMPAYEFERGIWYVGGNRGLVRPDLPSRLFDRVREIDPDYTRSPAAANRALATAAWQCVREQAG